MQRGEWLSRNVMRRLCVWAAILAGAVPAAHAQSRLPRVEAGGLVTLLWPSGGSDTNVGIGGRLTVNLAPWLAVDGEYQFIPDDDYTLSSVQPDGREIGLRYERRRSTALIGVKAGYRGERVGVFGKVRPGVTSLTDRGVECRGDVCAFVLLAVPEYRPEFAVDLGGVLEIYPSSRWLLRADVGSLRVWHRGSAPPCGASCATWNPTASIGASVRF